jgi:hypothetical protein
VTLKGRLILTAVGLIAALPVSAQAPDPFEAAPPPTRAPAHVPQPAPMPLLQQPVTPPPSVSQNWEGTTGIWHVKAAVNGQKITGRIECFLSGNWTDWGPTFEGTVDSNGNVSAQTAASAPWMVRKIFGTLPHLNIEVTSDYRRLNCPNGQVELKKIT